jgi:hypothetical protein
LDPRPGDVCIEDIAHALANKCRYTGHCTKFYSVAQHCVLGSRHTTEPLAVLLHDAAEAYLPDVARPVKRYLPGFAAIEETLMRVILVDLDVPLPSEAVQAEVDEIDLRMLATEHRDIMGPSPIPWASIEGVYPFGGNIAPWGPEVAESQFLRRYWELTRNRKQEPKS